MKRFWCVSLLVLGCNSDVSFVDPGEAFGVSNPHPVPNLLQTDRLVQTTIPEVDVLFVVDNSCSMDAEQVLLASNFPSFMEWFEGSGLDYHIGVVSTDMVDPEQAGRLREIDGRRWVQDDTPDPEGVFDRMVQMGTSGHWEEKGRAAAYTAIELLKDDENQGFVRDDAGMHITVVSDENDDSGETPVSRDEFVDYLLNLRWSRSRVSFSSIVGPTSGCPDIGSPGTEYIEVTRRVGGVEWPICSDDWSDMLDQLGFLAVGLTREFYLSRRPLVDTLQLQVEADGNVLNNFVMGVDWHYDEVRNSVVFEEYVPDPLAAVVVTYQVLATDQNLDDPVPPTE